MRFLLLLLFVPPLALGATCSGYTSHKLHVMRQIRDLEPGASVETHLITDLWTQPGQAGVSTPAYWVAWNGADVRKPGHSRLNLPSDVFLRYRIGGAIEIVHVPGDEHPYHREDLYADDGNLALDQSLLTLERGFTVAMAAGAGVLLLVLLRRKPKPKAKAATPEP